MNDKQPLDPYKTMCVCRHNGKEVGRIAAASPKAEAYITHLAQHHGSIQVEYVEDELNAMLSTALNS